MLTDNENAFLERITEDIIKEQKIIITCMSANFAKRIFGQIKEKFPNYIDKVAEYTRDTKEKIKKDLIDPNTSWKDKNIIVHSATIEAGVDVTIPFDKQYCQIQSGRFFTFTTFIISNAGKVQKCKR